MYLEKAGFLYDTTYGYNDISGFRNGFCYPFRPFDISHDRELNLLEIPMNLMDGSILPGNPSFSAMWERAQKLIDITEKHHGLLTINWHSNTFNCPFKRDMERIFYAILRECHKRRAWMTNGEGIYQWVTQTREE